MRQFDYFKPPSYKQAFEVLTLPDKNVFVLAGGTDLIPHTRDNIWKPDVVVDIKSLPDMKSIEIKTMDPCCHSGLRACLFIGAAVTMNEIRRSDIVATSWNLLQQAASALGNEQVRNRATIGGNICTASPAADSAPALLALDANVLIKGPDGDRCLEVKHLFVGPKTNVLKAGEIVIGVLIPQPPEGASFHFEKLSRRKAGDLAIVSVAALASPAANGFKWRLALGAVAPTPIRAYAAESILNQGCDLESIDRAAAAAYGCCCPIRDIRSSMEYRQMMVVNITRQVINTVLTKSEKG
jgi:carbon-monoxide dehydrogenase medium subunit